MVCAFKFGITQKFWLDAPNDLGAHQPIQTQGETTNLNPVLTSRDPGSLEGLHICGTSNATEVVFHLLHLATGMAEDCPFKHRNLSKQKGSARSLALSSVLVVKDVLFFLALTARTCATDLGLAILDPQSFPATTT